MNVNKPAPRRLPAPPMPRHVPVIIPARPGAPPASDLAEYQAVLRAAPGLSAASKAQYCSQLSRLTSTVGRDVEWILGHPAEAQKLLLAAKRTDGLKMIEAPMTLKALIDSLVALLRHSAELRARFPDARASWDALYKTTTTSAGDRYETNTPTEKQKAAYVPWADVVAKSDAFLATSARSSPGSMDRIITAAYTLIPPMRADLGRVRIYKVPGDPVPKDAALVEPNHIVWTPPSTQTATQTAKGSKASKGTHGMRLVLRDFKTSRQRGAHEADLPERLVDVIVRSLAAHPRQHLVVSPVTGKPYDGADANAYAKYVSRVFSTLLGRHVTINTLRHSFANSLDLNDVTPRELGHIADALMHSPAMTIRYRFKNVEGAAGSSASTSGASASCQLICKKGSAAAAKGGKTPAKTPAKPRPSSAPAATKVAAAKATAAEAIASKAIQPPARRKAPGVGLLSRRVGGFSFLPRDS